MTLTGIYFNQQLALQKHVNGHFNTTEAKDNTTKRSSDPPVPKKLRVNGKKLRYRRQPFSGMYLQTRNFVCGVLNGVRSKWDNRKSFPYTIKQV